MKIIKKLTTILIISIMCIMYTKVMSIAATATIITETLRLRKEPSTDSKIVDLISEDEQVEILEANVGDDQNWYKVEYKGNIGYIYGRYIEVNDTTTNSNSNTTEPDTNTTTSNTTTQNTNTNTIQEDENNTNNENTNTVTNVSENNEDTNNTVENNIQAENTDEEENSEPEENDDNTILASAPVIEINTYKTVNEKSELYIIPLINASKIHTVEPEQQLYIIQILNEWAYVRSENNYGWIRCSELN